MVPKSAMIGTELDYSGRPFGGVARTARAIDNMFYGELETNNDRLAGVGIYDSDGTLIQSVVSTYMPYYNNKPEQAEMYISTIDSLQVFVDKHGPSAPIKILADNTKLPQNCDNLPSNWYKGKGFNMFSHIMNDFLVSNMFSVCDFNFKQNHGFTYFCEASGVYTWIDHGLSTSYDGDDILGCLVEPIEIDNVSDHVPITLSMLISVKRVTSHDTHGMSGITNRKYVPPNWCSYEKILKYQDCIALRLRDIDMRELSVGSGNDARLTNSYIDSINEAIHRATIDANCIPRKQFIPKPYWCPGIDGITSEHLAYGKSYELCQHLSRVYSLILPHGIVPEIFRTGIVIPLLKKPTLNPNHPTNYRPITLSSVHTKLIEAVIMPTPVISRNQLGFRADRGASFGISFLHDIVEVFKQVCV